MTFWKLTAVLILLVQCGATPDWGSGVPIPTPRLSGWRGDSRAGPRANQSSATPDWGTGVPIPAPRLSGSRGDSRAGPRANQSSATPAWGYGVQCRLDKVW